MNTLRTGYTTGSCATAAAKGALKMLLSGRLIGTISITLPGGEVTEFALHDTRISNGSAHCAVRKDSGDDPDVTNGLMIHAKISLVKKKGVVIKGGAGVGTVTKPGLQIPVGESAINRTPRAMICRELEQLLDEHECHKGAMVEISAPGGEEIALKTFNPKLGIIGGISIIGTTGKVKPFSVPAIKKSLVLFLDQAKAYSCSFVVMVPGNIGEKTAHSRYLLVEQQVVQMSNYIGYMIRQAAKRFQKVLILGHPGKLVKVLLNCYNTHSQRSKSALPYLKSKVQDLECYAGIHGDISVSPTVEGIISSIPSELRLPFFSPIASQIEGKLAWYAGNHLEVGVVLVDMDCNCIGLGKRAREWEESGCIQLRS